MTASNRIARSREPRDPATRRFANAPETRRRRPPVHVARPVLTARNRRRIVSAPSTGGRMTALPESAAHVIEPDTLAFLQSLQPAATGAPVSVAEARLRESRMQAVAVAGVRADSEDGVIRSLG